MDEHQCDRLPRLANTARQGAADFIPIRNFLGTTRPLSEKEIHFGDGTPGAPGLALLRDLGFRHWLINQYPAHGAFGT
jgi:hypothetical protein